MKYNDQVTYVRNGVSINATVAASRQVEGKEHLTLIYLDPAMESAALTGTQLDRCVAKAFDVAPLVDGGLHGWFVPCRECGGVPCRLDSETGEAVQQDAILKSSGDGLNAGDWTQAGNGMDYPALRRASKESRTEPPSDTNPSAADLDAIATEQKAKEATTAAQPEAPSTPAEITPEAIEAQDAHDHETGNVNAEGQTPSEAVDAERESLIEAASAPVSPLTPEDVATDEAEHAEDKEVASQV